MPLGRARRQREPLREEALFEYAVRTLARAMRSERNLRRLLGNRACEGEAGERDVNAVVARLKELRYLSDIQFAADYTRLRKENERFGRRRVQQDLAQKGIARELAERTVAAAYEEIDEASQARAYIARKRMKRPEGPDSRKETARTINRLLRAGFSSSAIFKVLREWGAEVEETDLDSLESEE